VLYEMITGHRAFPDADWLHLVARGGREVPPTEPTEYVDSLNPDVASVLLRCLEEDAADRPASVLEVLASLPGGDPLRAALEAGETPSPEMVAGVSEQRALAPWQAAALYAVFALSVVVFHLTADKTTLVGMVEPKIHREALEDRARTLLHDIGWKVRHDPPADSFGAFRFEEFRVESFEGASVTDWRARAKSRPSLITYYFRSSDSSLFDPREDLPQPSIPEPRPGDALVVYDPEGRLEQLRLDPRPGAAFGNGPDWTQAFAWAGLELAAFRELPPPPLNSGGLDLPVHSQRRAWVGRVDGTDLRVDAASFGSLPVFFRLALNHDQPPRFHTLIAKWLFVAFFLLLGLAGFAAFRNVRQRRGDIRGAVTTAGLVAGATLLAEILWQQGGSGLSDVRWLDGIVSTIAYRAFVVMIFYLSMEPAVRSWAPGLLVSWTRLIRGRGLDSRIGRDTLIGLAVGVGLTSSVLYFEKLWDPTPLVVFDLSSKLSGVGPALGLLGWLGFIAVTGTFAVALLQASLERWLRHRWLAGLLLALAVALLAQSAIPAVLPLAVAAFGVLAAIVAWIAFGLVLFFPATADPSLWWAWPEAWMMSSLLLAVGAVAYRQAIGLGAGTRTTRRHELNDIAPPP
jgi:serine/threonine-protein kinase